MTRLSELFEEAAAEGAPPSGWNVAEAYARGRSRRRLRITAVTAVVTVAVAGAGFAVPQMLNPEGVRVGGVDTSGSAPPEPEPESTRPSWLPNPPDTAWPPGIAPPARPNLEEVRFSEVYDPDHLFAVSSDVCQGCPPTRHTTADGGRTWQAVDTLNLYSQPYQLIAPRTLVAARPGGLSVSTDGGRTWAPLTALPTPAAELPAGVRPLCAIDFPTPQRCEVMAVDSAAKTIRPLANQPNIVAREGFGIEHAGPANSGFWLTGYDPATRKPAVSVTQDRGRTWQTRVFQDGRTVPEEGWWQYLPQIRASAGTAYAMVKVGNGRSRLYYSRDGGRTWGVPPGDPAVGHRVIVVENGKDREADADSDIVTTDGRHIISAPDANGHNYRTFERRPDGRYVPVQLAGLPAELHPDAALGRGYWAAHPNHGLYVSDNGRTWRKLA